MLAWAVDKNADKLHSLSAFSCFIINDLFKKTVNALFQSLVTIGCCIAKLLLDTDQLIVLSHAVGTRK